MRCLIVDDHMVLSAGLSMLIKTGFPDWQVEFASTVKMAVELLGDNPSPAIDLVIVDMILPGESGLSLLQHIQMTQLKNPVKSLVISGLTDSAKIESCRAMGANGYIFKNDAPEHVLSAIQVIVDGGSYFGEVDAGPPNVDGVNLERMLTLRQRDILDLIMHGYANKRIAFDLDLSYGTVKNYIHTMMKTLDVSSRTNMVLYAQKALYTPRTPEEIISGKKQS